MKKSCNAKAGLIALLTLLSINLFAQMNPYFEMTLYFEDAVGNRDSVVFGYDRDATNDVDSEWGEIEITSPFDSVFDVRIGNFEHDKLAKRMINRTGVFVNDTTCFSGGSASIYINSIHQPIKIWWDKEQLLSNECFRGGFIINHILDILVTMTPNEIPPIYYCMADTDTVYFNVGAEMSEWPIISIEKEVEGQGLQTIYALRVDMGPSWAYTPCYWVTSVNDIVRIDKISLYPNPTVDKIWPILPDGKNIERAAIYDSMGRLVWQGQGLRSSEEIDVSSFASGLYRLKIYADEGKVFIGSFVKK